MKQAHFSDAFKWGVAAAAYQIEGAYQEDGKSLSWWDTFTKRPGAIKNGDHGDIACDHYHRYPEDIAMMSDMGVQAYRMSVSWPRIIPEGFGKVNQKGLDFYDRIIENLLQKNITPYMTMYHWDYPQALYNRGGWLSPDSPKWFAEYAAVVTKHFSDRVSHFMPHNEPAVTLCLGHQLGVHAPGQKLDMPDLLQISHNLMLSHGLAVQAIRSHAKRPVQVGTANVTSTFIPASNATADIESARRANFDMSTQVTADMQLWNTGFWFDPMIKGQFPKDYETVFGGLPRNYQDGDLKIIAQPLDFIGFNLYQSTEVRADQNGNPEVLDYGKRPGFPTTHFDWPVTPNALYWIPKMLSERYGKYPIYITENGMACMDWKSLDGKVHDPQRIDFLNRYLLALDKAAEEGVNMAGYFQWSIMDNFEWAEGYDKRFGLVYVDYETQERILKDSAHWYSNVIRTNGDALHQIISK